MQTRREFFWRVGRGWGLGCGVVLGAAVRTRGQAVDWLEAGRRWLGQEVDPEVLQALRNGDASVVDRILQEVDAALRGDVVLDLAGLQDAANLVLPWLERRPETRPYTSWLRSRMDYFKVADQLRRQVPATPTVPGQPRTPPPNPTPAQERRVWQAEVSRQPAPAGAAGWVAKLKPTFRAAGVPTELAWLPEIESGFDPQARSPAGAAGMFQLMPTTAQAMGLRLRPSDERLDPDKSAAAAARYLRRLHDQFKDWPLALAGYNAGPGRVQQVLAQRRARSFDAIAPSLPAETQLYVPKFDAVLRRREGGPLAGLRVPENRQKPSRAAPRR